MSKSTNTPRGAVATNECGFSLLTETNGLAIPSCDAEVGMLTNGFFRLNAHNFATSTYRPPPNPMIMSLFVDLTFFCITFVSLT